MRARHTDRAAREIWARLPTHQVDVGVVASRVAHVPRDVVLPPARVLHHVEAVVRVAPEAVRAALVLLHGAVPPLPFVVVRTLARQTRPVFLDLVVAEQLAVDTRRRVLALRLAILHRPDPVLRRDAKCCRAGEARARNLRRGDEEDSRDARSEQHGAPPRAVVDGRRRRRRRRLVLVRVHLLSSLSHHGGEC